VTSRYPLSIRNFCQRKTSKNTVNVNQCTAGVMPIQNMYFLWVGRQHVEFVSPDSSTDFGAYKFCTY